jgi:hypothetical protein
MQHVVEKKNVLHAWKFGQKNAKEGGNATHNKKQKRLCVGTLDTKNTKSKGGHVQHTIEKKMYCTLGGLDTKKHVAHLELWAQ